MLSFRVSQFGRTFRSVGSVHRGRLECLTGSFTASASASASVRGVRREYVGLTSSALGAKKIKVNDESTWVSVSFSTEAERQDVDMRERLQNAEQWQSMQMSDKDFQDLNRALGIEDEVLDYEKNKDKNRQLNQQKNKAKKEAGGDRKQTALALEERVRGFLELNPQMCSGCGTSFQTKHADQPGYLQPDKFDEHKSNAKRIREKQEALKILDMAGIDVDSPVAEEILARANVSKEIIEGVKSLRKGKNSRAPGGGVEGVRGEGVDGTVTGQKTRLSKSVSQVDANDGDFDDDSDEEDDAEALIDPSEMIPEEEEGQEPAINLSLPINDLTGNSPKVSPDKPLFENGVRMRYKGWEEFEPLSPSEIDNLVRGVAPGALPYSAFKKLKEERDILSESICVCQRCFRLQTHGTVDDALRPGWSDNELLTPERFEGLLQDIRNQQAVVLCLVDVFDLQGSLLPNLKQIAGENPIFIAANKVDLLPKDVSQPRLKQWIYDEVRSACGLRSLKEFEDAQQRRFRMIQNAPSPTAAGGSAAPGPKGYVKKVDESGVLRHNNVHLVSCDTGAGLNELIDKVMAAAEDHGKRVYVLGAANVGKSSFVNLLLENTYGASSKLKLKPSERVRPRKKDVPQATVSNIPGTTLDFLRIRMPNGITMIDTPGLINKGILTSRLTAEELKKVIPKKPINAVTFRLNEQQAVLIGGLATVEVVEGRPFYLSFFVSNEIKIHVTNATKAVPFIQKHIGDLVFPPNSFERWQELGPYESVDFQVKGDSWEKSSADIIIAGLGWIAVTGPGLFKIRVTVPQGTMVQLRDTPILPFEAKWTTAKFSGGRIIKKSRKEDGYGWRA